MKKFITIIPLQPVSGLHKTKYAIADNSKLQYEYYGEEENSYISFPILAALSGYIQKGETVQVIAIVQKYENAEQNFIRFQEELKTFEELRGCKCELIEIKANYSEYVDDHLSTFENIISHIESEDELHACVTFGSKASSMVEMLAINYAYRALENVKIGCIVYGHFDHETKISTIYDVTRLFFMDEVVRNVADLKLDNPLDYIKMVLDNQF